MKPRKALYYLIILMVGLVFVIASCEPGDFEPIEQTYAEDGPFATTSESITDFTIFYPEHMEGNHPIISWGNGTALPTLVYQPLLYHLASWGFVVIASDSVMTQSGDSLIEGIDYLIEQNGQVGSKFFGMLDTNHIGTTGHSQGGGGAINAATDERVTCSVPIAPSPGWICKVNGPIFLIAGSDDVIASPLLVRTTSYMPATGPTVFGIVHGMRHLEFAGDAGAARGYITAWFMYHLQGDAFAGDVFTGSCEICANENWEVEMKNFP